MESYAVSGMQRYLSIDRISSSELRHLTLRPPWPSLLPPLYNCMNFSPHVRHTKGVQLLLARQQHLRSMLIGLHVTIDTDVFQTDPVLTRYSLLGACTSLFKGHLVLHEISFGRTKPGSY